jgi:hypothetical protein
MEHDPAFLFLSADDEVEEERKAAREHMEKKAIKKVMKTKSQQFQVGDVVRYLIATRSSELRKQQKTSRVSNLKWAPVKWTPELYRIKGIVQVRDSDAPKQKTQYTLENMNGRALGAGKRFFANQLQLVAKAGKRIPDGMDMDPDLARQLNRLGDEAQPQPAPRQRQPRQQPPPIPQPPRRGSRQRQAPQRPMQDSYVYEN